MSDGAGPYISSAIRAPARRTRPPISHEEVEHERDTLMRIITAIAAAPAPDGALHFNKLREILRQHPRAGRGFFSKSQILAGYRALREGSQGSALLALIDEPALIDRLRFRPTRTQSGVTPVTVLTKPFPCPGECIFCPNDVRMPKSYLSDEPAAQRAEDNGFDPFVQTWVRLSAFYAMGHPLSKVELIILGGTWSFYPESYQRWFVKRCLDALNTFDGSPTPKTNARPFADLPRHVDGRALDESYNQVVTRRLRVLYGGSRDNQQEACTWESLERAQRKNENAPCKVVGMVMETRPDYVSEEEIIRLRRLGATKTQIGFQSLNDEVLSANKRGHDVEATARTVSLLRRAGLKIHAHWMLNLKGSSPTKDCADFDRVVGDPRFMPDELKIYPCSLIESAELMRSYEDGSWSPYTREDLLRVLGHTLSRTPRYCRITRMIRDIPATDIVVGNRRGNLREDAQAAQAARPTEIRSREVRDRDVRTMDLVQRTTTYETTSTTEHFIEWVSEDDLIAGFLRLALPKEASYIEELGQSAIIREVHVYGRTVSVGARDQDAAQHRGLGKKLIAEACHQAASAGYRNIAVISAIGTRDYYRKLGFRDGPLYQHRATADQAPRV